MTAYELWMPALPLEIKKWHFQGHFARSDVGKYVRENKIAHEFSNKSPIGSGPWSLPAPMHYCIILPALEDSHLMWLMMKGCLICKEGESGSLKFPSKDYQIRILPQKNTDFWHIIRPSR